MKIRLFSQKGLPVDREMAKLYDEEFKVEYDLIWTRYESKEIDMDTVRKLVDEKAIELTDKYPNFVDVELPKSAKAWKELQMKYECPITVAIAAENNKLTLFLMDAGY